MEKSNRMPRYKATAEIIDSVNGLARIIDADSEIKSRVVDNQTLKSMSNFTRFQTGDKVTLIIAKDSRNQLIILRAEKQE